jgi:hypothetical protein
MTTLDEFTNYLKPKFQHFVVNEENKQFKTCVKSFSKDSIVSIVDLLENYNFETQNKVPNMHWFSYQINILVT